MTSLLSNLTYPVIFLLMLKHRRASTIRTRRVTRCLYHAANGSMNVWLIILFATIGAGIWNCILAALGWYMQSIVPEGQFNDKLTQYGHYISIVAIILLAIGIAVICHKRKEVRNASLMQKAKNDIDQFLSVI